MRKITKDILLLLAVLMFFILCVGAPKKVYASDVTLTNTTRAYFCSEVTNTYGNGDCILLENYDSEGNKIYGLIDTGRKINKTDNNENSSTVVKEFLKEHGVKKLEFLLITHSHVDHNGDTITVLDNFEVDTIYMKEFDKKWSPSGTQDIYEDIIEKAIVKNIKVIGVSYLSLKSKDISPSMSEELINNTQNAKENLFESFYNNNDKDTNTIFGFGSATVQLFNWEIFDEEGNQYITGTTTKTTREIVKDENNDSIALLLTQGNKKALFAGDMNNLDKNGTYEGLGDEDRLKDIIGDVDFLKLGHHGYQGSNTENYMNVLKPEYAVITNDIDNMYKETANWLNENKVNYLYTTTDKYGISATITNSEVYLGFETTGETKNVNGTSYYIPDGDEYKYVDYTKINNKTEDKEKLENKNNIIENDSVNIIDNIINDKNNNTFIVEETTDLDIAAEELPYAGEKNIIICVLIIFVIFTVVYFIKLKIYKDVK